MKRFAPAAQPAIIGIAIGVLLPFVIALCLFGTTLQSFLAPPLPDAHFWSGAATPVPQPTAGPVQAAGGTALRSAGGTPFLLGSIVFAVLGAWLAWRRWEHTIAALIGAAVGAVAFMVIALWGFLM